MVRAIHLLFLLLAAGVVNLLLYADALRHALPAARAGAGRRRSRRIRGWW